MSNRDNGRSVLVTGASTGIGLCVAQGLEARGYRVIAAARRPSDLQRLRDSGLFAVQLDLASSASVRAAAAAALERTGGRLYGLFNNAAYGQPGAVEDLSREVLREQFETNLFGTHELTNAVLPVMRQQGHGRIVQNSSVLGLIALAYRGAYNASKFALEGLSETLRLELAGTDIHVSLIEPGPILSCFRANSYAAFRRHIEPANSVHRERYLAMEKRLRTEGAAVPFTLPPEAVLKRVIHALESPRPRAHYYVTFPTRLFAALRRVLPYAMLEQVLRRV